MVEVSGNYVVRNNNTKLQTIGRIIEVVYTSINGNNYYKSLFAIRGKINQIKDI